ncbi:hypothetical protein DPMN_141059 [Dreissena polymorpha]|uniref:Uncharacterized protein n=1 Tax=Dreissena polymorpha TaxID=45954 RepID=A0A9D4GC24_DREPO|nr:hypothetical protein DPMN_141059 [Dreissena polymorpha]
MFLLKEEKEEKEGGVGGVVGNIRVRDWIAKNPPLGLYDGLMVELRNQDPTAF